MSEGPDAVDMVGAAAELGVHYDTLRKHWREWAGLAPGAGIGLPRPFRYPEPGQRGRIAWRLTALQEWKLRREAALGRCAPDGQPNRGEVRHLATVRRTGDRDLERQRHELARMMGSRG